MELIYMIKNGFIKGMATALILVMGFSTTAFAKDDVKKNYDDEISLVSDSYSGSISKNMSFSYTDQANVKHIVEFHNDCSYTVNWDEGSYGWVTDAIFSTPTNTKIDNTSVRFTAKYASSMKKSSIAYMDYYINGSNFLARNYISCDEWGEVTMRAYGVE